MLKMSKESRAFLLKHLPEALNVSTLKEALRLLYDKMDVEGFAPPHYDQYNDFGEAAQKVYDDLLNSNVSPKK